MNIKTDVSIVRMEEYTPEEAKRALTEALAPFGGVDWVKEGMKIAVKVNLLTARKPEDATTTHPVLVCALCEMLCERGAKVVVGDSPGGLFNAAFLLPIYKITGMASVEKAGATLNDNYRERDFHFPGAVKMKDFRITEYLLEADAVINFCKLKTHGLMAFTGACKNLFGAIPGLKKSECHYLFPKTEDFADMLVDICEAIKPVINIADGVVAMEGNGPTVGTPRKLGALLAAENAHALDLAAGGLMGLTTKEAPTLSAALRRGLIPESVKELNIQGDYNSFVADDFKIPPIRPIKSWGSGNPFFSDLLESLLANKPHVLRDKCVGCGICLKRCPAGAITMRKNRPVIDRKKCIRCFCCQEFCEREGMVVRRSFLGWVVYHR